MEEGWNTQRRRVQDHGYREVSPHGEHRIGSKRAQKRACFEQPFHEPKWKRQRLKRKRAWGSLSGDLMDDKAFFRENFPVQITAPNAEADLLPTERPGDRDSGIQVPAR